MTTATRNQVDGTRRQRIRRLPDLSTHLAFWLPAANVLMQLADPAVGYGVLESRVTSGRGDLHPVKRARTTAQYLSVATIGSEKDRQFFHDEVHKIHSRVVSTESSPVRYSANAAKAQLWVALCLVKYYTDQWEMLNGPLPQADLDHVIDIARPLGTTLNVPDKWWPSDWAEFERKFDEGLAGVRIDDPVRDYLQSLADYSVLEVRMGRIGKLAHKLIGPWALTMTKFGVPQRVRDEMRWEITAADLRRRRRVLNLSSVLGRILPRPLWVYYTWNLLDLRTRRRLGLRVF